MKVLVSGGTGYIGSHTVVELMNLGYEVVIVDNLYNSQLEVLDKIKQLTNNKALKFYEADCSDLTVIEPIFIEEKIDAIIHFAGYKAVGESVAKPLKYYQNNLNTTMVLAMMAEKYKVQNFIFSSSATVYGEGVSPLVETMDLKETSNPYGETKKMSERILRDFAKNNPDMKITLLRYFNPIGAHKSGLIGEKPQGIPNNLMPYVTQVAKGIREKLFVFGNDYDTVDGTGVRDYIHVVDLAKGHIAALKGSKDNVNIYNLGSGVGTSVLELIQTFEKVNHIKIPYEIVDRRPGDLATVYADVNKAKKELNWQTELTIEDMVKDAWRFENNLK
ncbi:UDP-glucose 4-epimerase [Acholeplasma oculi]|uniref:UDP-glucose 4-epimerase n=1 Tax=Acholeplasma oculi TaxID=35623 RepID=A0A061A9E9_9MOLU|nr:UDP-glucose 4-epimerase GalE [Acholeplasma oculi]CDR30483.1 UDP-glucose 4-epimerase GalE [Acholeplasma oculi]SKC48131.1 UDP-glucose 4-epimerase [Acholeplasma oculi]SUT89108.1 UDP-glucose 4-epimerase [Acholeplasma oculi]